MPLRRCAYCGATTPKPVACHAHQDLPALDPRYAPALRQTTTGHWQPAARRAA